jgi:hypothetical protein
MNYATNADGTHHLVIGPVKGTFANQLQNRAYELRIHAAGKPKAVAVDGTRASQSSWGAAQDMATVTLPRQGIRNRIEVTWR